MVSHSIRFLAVAHAEILKGFLPVILELIKTLYPGIDDAIRAGDGRYVIFLKHHKTKY